MFFNAEHKDKLCLAYQQKENPNEKNHPLNRHALADSADSACDNDLRPDQ